jgi:hypothetical protein
MGFLLFIIMVGGTMKTDQEKAKQFFKYNYYQWQTPRTLREAMRYSMVKAWRKQHSDVKQSEGAI